MTWGIDCIIAVTTGAAVYIEEMATQADSLSASLISLSSTVSSVVEVASNIIVIVGGILGLSFFWNLRKKQRESIFGYLTRLQVMLSSFSDILNKHSDVLVSYCMNKCNSTPVGTEISNLLPALTQRVANNASETLKFLKDEESQMPAQLGWTNHFDKFVAFLLDCERIGQQDYCMWANVETSEEEFKNYYVTAKDNIDKMIEMIKDRRIYLEEKLFRRWYHLIFRLIKRMRR